MQTALDLQKLDSFLDFPRRCTVFEGVIPVSLNFLVGFIASSPLPICCSTLAQAGGSVGNLATG